MIQLVVEILLREFNLPQVKAADPGNLIVTMDDRRCLSLCLGQDDVDEILHRRNNGDPLEIVLRHGNRVGQKVGQRRKDWCTAQCEREAEAGLTKGDNVTSGSVS